MEPRVQITFPTEQVNIIVSRRLAQRLADIVARDHATFSARYPDEEFTELKNLLMHI